MNEAKKGNPTSAPVPAGKAEILKKLASIEAENADLKRRLAESQDILLALISEQVDAVMDSATATPLLLHETQAALQASETLLPWAETKALQRRFSSPRTSASNTPTRLPAPSPAIPTKSCWAWNSGRSPTLPARSN